MVAVAVTGVLSVLGYLFLMAYVCRQRNDRRHPSCKCYCHSEVYTLCHVAGQCFDCDLAINYLSRPNVPWASELADVDRPSVAYEQQHECCSNRLVATLDKELLEVADCYINPVPTKWSDCVADACGSFRDDYHADLDEDIADSVSDMFS